ncbi:O-antigen ligase family protein [Ornithinibacillus sp. 4-3]|uniref:O-antigen ligase family protein n=1 Tax=Ornithinibacillus sp. 4-3 TaxID=3231488 RepID=A0AB39HQV9_9BACI
MRFDSIFINKKNIIFILFLLISLFLLIEPVVFVFTELHTLFRIGQVIVIFICIFLFFVKKCDFKFLILTLIFFFYQIIVTLLNDGAIVKVVTTMIPVVGMVLLLQYAIERNYFLTIKALYMYFSIIVYINYLLMIIYPEGILQATKYRTQDVGYNFLSVNNQLGSYLLIAALISILYCILKKKVTLNAVFLNIVVYMTLLNVWSVTSIIWLTFFYGFYFLMSRKNKVLKWKKYFSFMLLAHILIVVLEIQKIFSFLIVDFFEKDITLSGRTRIWELAIQEIKKTFIFGYGEIQDARYITIGTAEFNAHNIFLQVMLQGGFILLMLFLMLMIYSLNKTALSQNNKIASILIISVITLWGMMITEVYSILLQLLVLFLVYNCKKFIVAERIPNINRVMYVENKSY